MKHTQKETDKKTLKKLRRVTESAKQPQYYNTYTCILKIPIATLKMSREKKKQDSKIFFNYRDFFALFDKLNRSGV